MKKGKFENHPPSPSLPLKKGLHRSLGSLSSGVEDLKPGRPGLYEQTSSRPKGLLVEFDAIKLRLFMRRGRPCGTDGMADASGNVGVSPAAIAKPH